MAVDDLAADVLATLLGSRPVRSYPALLSTEADAQAWARQGAPSGAVVVADYQASPRGRGGLPWQVRPGTGLGFSVVLRPQIAGGAEGWLYVCATEALAAVLGDDTTIAWPDTVLRGDRRAAAVGMQSELGPGGLAWAVVTVLIDDVLPPRAALLDEALRAIDARVAEDRDALLARYRPRCVTFGRRVRARLMPLGPRSPAVVGDACDVWLDGALAIDTAEGRRRAVRPQDLGALEEG